MSKQVQISDAEWEIMKILWSEPGLSAKEVADRLTDSNWHLKTVRTMLDRLNKKKVLEVESIDRLYRYTPLLDREDCIANASNSFLSRVFDGAISPMVAHFVKDSSLSKEERGELEKILNKLDQQEAE